MDYEYLPKDRISWTKKIPQCPKCGSRNTKRFYEKGGQGYGSSYDFLDWDDIEFLDVVCQDCHYSFPQKTKEGK